STESIFAKLLYVTSAKYEGDWPSLKHTHYFSELFYVKSGQGQFMIEDEVFSIQKDDLVIVNPNIEHTEVSLDTTPLECVILGVEGIEFSFPNQNEYLLFNCKDNNHNLMFYFNTLLTEITKKEQKYEQVCKDLLEVLIINLIRYNHFSFDIAPSQKVSRECGKIKRYIDANYSEEVTLEMLAEKAHLNKYYFAHAFSDAFGISPMNYLIEKRIQTCKELLSSTDHSIADIARLTGFSSQSYFSQSFKKNCGMSAGVYRKQMHKNTASSSD
ncbi:MAG: AraC family transcriptional regulator, partial [Lachnospiraceae bacterium]